MGKKNGEDWQRRRHLALFCWGCAAADMELTDRVITIPIPRHQLKTILLTLRINYSVLRLLLLIYDAGLKLLMMRNAYPYQSWASEEVEKGEENIFLFH